MKDHLRQLVGGFEPLFARNVAREYLQARILGALQRAGAMTSLAFQGGTCLRFLYSLPRYSEDLDFALEGDASRYNLPRYLRTVRTELSAEHYQVDLRIRQRRRRSQRLRPFPRRAVRHRPVPPSTRIARRKDRSRHQSARRRDDGRCPGASPRIVAALSP